MLSAYALGELEPDDTARVSQALIANPALKEELKQIQQTIGAVQSVLQDTDPAVRLKADQSNRVFASILASEPQQPATLPMRRQWYRDRRFVGLLAVAATVPLAMVIVPEWFVSKNELAKSISVPEAKPEASRPEAIPMEPVAAGSNLAAAAADRLTEPAQKELSQPLKDLSEDESGSADKPTAPTSDTLDSVRESTEVGLDTGISAKGAGLGGMGAGSGGMGPGGFGQNMNTDRAKVGDPRSAKGGPESAPLERMSSESRTLATNSAAPADNAPSDSKTTKLNGSPSYTADASLFVRNEKESDGKQSEGKQSDGKPSDAKRNYSDALSLSTTVRSRDSEQESARMLPDELAANVPLSLRKRNDSPAGDRFEPIIETPFVTPAQAPLSTFSVDVDTASYSKIRQYLTQTNSLPVPNMVRIEEMINYFEYNYAGPTDKAPFSASLAMEPCPWNREHQLVRVGLQARKLERSQRPKANLVFLLDVSGSMDEPNKLPLVKRTLALLTEQLTENDRVAIVVYAGAAGCVLPSTIGSNKQAILDSLNHLNAGGSTNGGQGIQLAYSIAKEHFVPGGVNRVILCTDGDFNVGITGDDALVEMLEANAKSNIFLTCLGYGKGNYNDSMMEKISNRGNGIYGMIDSEMEARRMMVEQLQGTLVTVAKDVKIQVDFNPSQVASYRLIGYEDRRLAAKDFDNDQKDAGEIGAGHRVTALYEIAMVGGSNNPVPSEDGETSKYAKKPTVDSAPIPSAPQATDLADEILTLKVRYKEPEGTVSAKQEFVLKKADQNSGTEIDRDLHWASAVAEFGLLLRQSNMAPHADWGNMIERAAVSAGGDAYRLECVQMMRKAAGLAHSPR
jgi:Ca-activated chloride channel family protein